LRSDPESRRHYFKKLPKHVAVIMDGNGRWARRRLKNRVYGHEAGIEAVKTVIRCCVDCGIPYLTLYAFSKENWQRPKAEIDSLWRIMKKFLQKELSGLIEKGIKILHIGDRESLPSDVLAMLDNVVEKTKNGENLIVQVALNYGGRHEIVEATRRIAEKVKRGEMKPDDINLDTFAAHLFTAGVPDPDLLIRTSGECRVSNFLLWQIAYTELYIIDTLWPDFGEKEFYAALEAFQTRERRFGKISEQLTVAENCSAF